MSFLDLKRNQGDEHLRARDLFYAMWISVRPLCLAYLVKSTSGTTHVSGIRRTCLWSALRRMPSGVSSILALHLASRTCMATTTRPCMPNTSLKAGPSRWSRHTTFGLQSSVFRSRQAIRTCSTRMHATPNRTRRIWGRSNPQTYVRYVHSARAPSTSGITTHRFWHNTQEIIQFTSNDEIAVCNLGSLSLPAFVDGTDYDYAALHSATKTLARNLNRVIDVTFYPLEEARASNLRHRPIGMGVQGLADVFFRLKIPFDSPEAAEVNRKIFATIYHAGIETSCDLADEDGVYDSYQGSPASLGQLQFDLWGAEPHAMYDWARLKQRVARGGIRNSLLVAPMPTASTAQVMGNTECFEPITSNLYSRTTLAGTFTVVNKYLLNDLLDRGLWNQALKQKLVAAEGSVQNLDIPADLKAIYKTAYEISMKTVLDLAADRGIYVDQSMSLNMFMPAPTFRKLSSMHFYAWRRGLKTGMYYLRSKAASGATKITVDTVTAGGGSPVECIACSG